METPAAEELLKKIQELEAGQVRLKQEMSMLKLSTDQPNPISQRSHSMSPQRTRKAVASTARDKGSTSIRHSSPLQRESRSPANAGISSGELPTVSFSNRQYLNILQSMGQSLIIYDLDDKIFYWNRSAENIYGFSAKEALGQNLIDLLVDQRDVPAARNIIHHVSMGESWTGEFPVKKKSGERFSIVATTSPLYDDNHSLVGIICVSADSQPFHELRVAIAGQMQTEGRASFNRITNAVSSKLDLDSQQPIQTSFASRISNMANKVSSKVKSKIKTIENYMDREGGSSDSDQSSHGIWNSTLSDDREETSSNGASTPRGDLPPLAFGVFSHADECLAVPSRYPGDEVEGRPSIQKIFRSKAEQWICRKGLLWPWKGNEHDEFPFPSRPLPNDQEHGKFYQKANNDTYGTVSSSININSSGSASSCGSTSSSTVNKLDMDSDCLDCEILWEDMTIGERIGQGSCGTVYHGLWFGSDVAVKVFTRQEYSEELIYSFKQEVSLMKRLRHPNVLLFMGAVTSPERLCIVTEFLPRGSLFRLLQKSSSKLDTRRRILMAMDIARGMNYLHHCSPPIIHRDLKSSNLLVDKNWTVKVGDFGLSRLKHETYLNTKTGKGTPQWMAPEILRNEPSNEKSDVYSYGVILWELATERVPWDNLNSMQVIGAVGFMNQRLEIPKEVDPLWVPLIESCWHSDPKCRPTFQDLMDKFRELARQSSIQLQASRSTCEDSRRK